MTTITTITKPTNTRLLILHCVLVLLRFVSAMFGTGYVHPDEHFQSIQPAFRDVFSSGGETDETHSTTMVKELTSVHGGSNGVVCMAYNGEYECVVSCDQSGGVEAWSADPEEEFGRLPIDDRKRNSNHQLKAPHRLNAFYR